MSRESFPITGETLERRSDLWSTGKSDDSIEAGDSVEEEPPYKVEFIDDGYIDWIVTCPHCDNGVIVHGPTWRDGVGDEQQRSTRICCYCGKDATVMRPPGAKGRGDD